MMGIDNFVAKSRSNFDIWEKQLHEHLLLQYEPEAVETEAERERIFFQTNDLLISIAENFLVYGKFKDSWDTSKCSFVPFGQYVLLRSEKMDIVFNWGIEGSDFFLETYLMYSENIRCMTDEFWETLLELKRLGKFEYAGGGGLNPQQRPYFENKTSAIFQIIRTFMLNQTESMNDGNTQWEFGTLALKWEATDDWTDLLERTSKAFKLMYQLNYQLWKIHDLATKRRE